MADRLERRGQFHALKGIAPEIKGARLLEAGNSSIGSSVTLDGTEFDTKGDSGTPGENILTNTENIDFSLSSSDIGKTAAKVSWRDGDNNVLITTNLDETQLVDAEGTFRLSTGDVEITWL